MAKLSTLAIVLPAYNEADRIGPALDELFGYLRQQVGEAAPAGPGERGGFGAPRGGGAFSRGEGPSGGAGREASRLPRQIELILVDDGSQDGTADLVRGRPEAGSDPVPGVTVQILTVPHAGKGAAVRAGMLAASSDVVVFTDADLATPPDQLPLLVAALETADVALGSRIQPDGSDLRQSQPRYRQLIGKAFHTLASWWVAGPVRDTQCGFKGFTRAAARDLFGRQQVTSIVFDVELIFLARRRGYRTAVVPIQWQDRRGSRMKARPCLALRVAWDLFRIPLVHRSVAPLVSAVRDEPA